MGHYSMDRYFESLPCWKQHGLALLIILILMGIYFYPMLFQNKGPQAGDIRAWTGASEAIHEYNSTHDDIALWAPNIFSGMPAITISVPSQITTVDTALKKLQVAGFPWQMVFFVFGGFFFYLFLRELGLSWLVSMAGALLLILLPHHLGLINAGHNTKVRAVMLTPVVGTAFLYFVRKTGLSSLAFLALSLALQARTSHYQIAYYSGFLLLFLGLPYLVRYVRQKQYTTMVSKVGLLIIAVLLAGVITSPTLVLTRQYLPYSIRGGGVDTENTTASSGLERDYATQWSFPPEEMLTFVMPDMFGGSSQFHYTGDAAPQLSGRNIPAYWGRMPFTTNVHYLGALSVFLALIGVIGFWKRSLVKSLVGLILLSLLVAFGKYFTPVFDLFFSFLPLFDKFRVPSMILHLVHFTVPVLAAFGFQYLLELNREQWKQRLKWIGGLAAGFIILALIPLVAGQNFALSTANEASRYQPQVQEMLRAARLEIMHASAWRLIIVILAGMAVIGAYLRRYISATSLVLICIGIFLIDMYTVGIRYIREWVPQRADEQVFQKTQVDKYLLNDEEMFRVFPVGQGLFNDNRWAYYHQSIGGYHAAKMASYQAMIEENLYSGWEQSNPINWNIVRMLNVKYLISNQQVRSEYVKVIGQDPDNNWVLHQMKETPPRAWMVYRTRVIPEFPHQRQVLNQASFNPMREALTGEQLIPQYDSSTVANISSSAEVTHFDANTLRLHVQTSHKGLLVVSENYIPIWWKATQNGSNVPIHRVNSFQRGIVVPQGSHEITMHAEAELFQASVISGRILTWGIHVILVIFLLTRVKNVEHKLFNRFKLKSSRSS